MASASLATAPDHAERIRDVVLDLDHRPATDLAVLQKPVV
jgi:hypothetical protein